MPKNHLPIPMLASYDKKQDRVILTIDSKQARKTDPHGLPDNVYITVKKDTPTDTALRSSMRTAGIQLGTQGSQYPTLTHMANRGLISTGNAKILQLLAEAHQDSLLIIADKPETALNLIAILNATTARKNNDINVTSVGKQEHAPYVDTGVNHVKHFPTNEVPWQEYPGYNPPVLANGDVLHDDSGVSTAYAAYQWVIRMRAEIIIAEIDQDREPDAHKAAADIARGSNVTYSWVVTGGENPEGYRAWNWALKQSPNLRGTYAAIVEVQTAPTGGIQVTQMDVL